MNSTPCNPQPSEREKIGDILAPPRVTPAKNTWDPKPNHFDTKLDTTPDPPRFQPKSENFQKRVTFVSERTGDTWAGEKQSEKPQPKQNPKSVRFHCGYCDKDGHQDEYCYRRKRDERNQKELANKDRYHPSRGVLEPCVEPPSRGVGSVRSVPSFGHREFTGGSPSSGRKEFAGVSGLF